MTDPAPNLSPDAPDQMPPAAASKMERLKEFSRKAWETYLFRLKKRMILYGAVAGVAVLLILIGMVTHRRRHVAKTQSAAAASAKPQPAKPAAPPAPKPAIAVSSAPPAAAPVNPAPAAMSQQDVEALRAKAAEEREARRKERQEKIDKALNACSLEIGIFCNNAKDQPDSAIRCLRHHESDLLKSCFIAMGALRAPSGDSNP